MGIEKRNEKPYAITCFAADKANSNPLHNPNPARLDHQAQTHLRPFLRHQDSALLRYQQLTLRTQPVRNKSPTKRLPLELHHPRPRSVPPLLPHFRLFKRMLTSETPPDNFTFACLARACSDKLDISALRAVHGKLIAYGLGDNFICTSALVSSYSRMGIAEEASLLFSGIDGEPDLVLCNAMVSCYGRCGDWIKGVVLFNSMMAMGIQPDGYTVVGLITGLKSFSLVNVGEMVHSFCVKCGLDLSDRSCGKCPCWYVLEMWECRASL